MSPLDAASATRGAVMPATHADSDRRWLALGFIALAQLMIALDATVVSVALPTLQHALGGTDAERPWIISAYTSTFAGLLLLGGRISDSIGRKVAFQIGLLGFAASSALGGAATDVELLIAARALQGVFAALLSPAALSLLAVTFSEPRERARAFAVFGGVAGSGGAVGLMLGGWLTENANWRLCLYVNVAFSVLALLGARLFVASGPPPVRRRIDVMSALLVTLGLGALVYGCAAALDHGWTSRLVLGALATGSVALGLFVARQRSSDAPLLPLSIVLERNRGGVALAAALAVVAMFGLFLLLTYYFQVVKHYSPLQTGLAFLPMSAAGLFGSTLVASRLLPHVAPRVLLVAGLSIAAAGLAGLTRLTPGSVYVSAILPCELAAGFGISCAMITAFSVATLGVAPHEAGIASAAIATAQQIGGSLGTALINTVAAASTAMFIRADPSHTRAGALVHGYASATGWGCAALILAALLAALLVTASRPSHAR